MVYSYHHDKILEIHVLKKCQYFHTEMWDKYIARTRNNILINMIRSKAKCKKWITKNLNTLSYWSESAKNTVKKIVKERETFTYITFWNKCTQKSSIFCSGREGGSRMAVPISKTGYNKKSGKKWPSYDPFL